MTSPAAISAVPRQLDLAHKLEALGDAVTSAQAIFARQLGLELEPVGIPGAPSADAVNVGATVALTCDAVNVTYGVVCDESTARQLARWYDNAADGGRGALAAISDLASGMWQALRAEEGEEYQLGLPVVRHDTTWLQHFARGVSAISQRLVGPAGIALQVVMMWQCGVRPGGVPLSHFSADHEVDSATAPHDLLQAATQAMLTVADAQLGLELEIGSDDDDNAPDDLGACIDLTNGSGRGWHLAVAGSQHSCQQLTRILLAMDPVETPVQDEVTDALGEIVNVTAGELAARCETAGWRLHVGMPLCVADVATSRLPSLSQTLVGPDGITLHLLVRWQGPAT